MIKKSAILCFILLSLNPAVFAADWIRLNITNTSKYIYLDHDSISRNENNLFYVIRYKDRNENEKLVYLKYDINEDKIGIIKSKSYDSQKYESPQVWDNPFAFMKKLSEDSFLNNINKFVKDDEMVQKLTATRQIRKQNAISNNQELIQKYNQKYPGMKDYIISVETKVKENWHLPVTNNGGIAKVQFKISRDGKLTSCEIRQSSGNKTNDDSAIAAVKSTEPFDKFPETADKNLKEINILMTFDYYVLDVNKKQEK